MTTKTNSDIMNDIEGRHFGRCIDQMWGTGRRTLIEVMDYPKGRGQAVIVKQYDSAVPRAGAGKPWPALTSAYVYLPAEDESNTWTGLDRALSDFEAKQAGAAVPGQVTIPEGLKG